METALLDEFATGDAVQRAESWRYSRNAVRALAQQAFTAADPQAPIPSGLVAQFDFEQTRGRRLVFVNGAYCARYSDLAGGATAVIDRSPGAVRLRLDGAVPLLHLVQLAVPAAAPSRWQGKLEIEVDCAQATLIEQQLAGEGAEVLGLLDLHIELAAGAGLDWLSLSDLGANASLVRRCQLALSGHSTCRASHALFGGRLQRLDLGVALAGEHARLESRGVFVLRGREHADMQLDIRHVARNAACDVLWRGVADQRARGIFHGGITVEPGADGSDARLSNKNVLLSPLAEIDTQPSLEIHADEVQAAHGATVGQIDERALFYLRSRGIGAEQARRMLVAAFCSEALAGVADTGLREHLARLVAARLPDPDLGP